VEAVLTLPLIVFLILGTLQLFMVLQARIMAQYATFMAAREGSVGEGNCALMQDVALKALLPTFTKLEVPADVETAYLARRESLRYEPSKETGFDGDIFWLIRERPLVSEVTAALADEFDHPWDSGGRLPSLELKMVFWYPLRVPFVAEVFTSMLRAHYAIENIGGANPLMLAQNDPDWMEGARPHSDAVIQRAFSERTGRSEYVMPIVVSASTTMLTPPHPRFFDQQNCSPDGT
jgi:hypothetical protein